ncbi:hypothetical protein [Haloechinothrix sp. LS1_15]|uniref:hypothetical protein n=1 Tax=Haloechinothrix sp. LS1_15 TaxID=2652248 RepID=UPI002946F0E3|nr:hypothetical protein [Haloechinothrix sp. LS1_15]MDV6012188.1 DUF1440 domain-containing protein [Haloechinothrix sp. LS1_15]
MTVANDRAVRAVSPLNAGAVAGGIAGVLFAVVMVPPEFIPMVGALYGFEGSMIAGWIFHLLHSIFFGLVFVGLTRAVRPLARIVEGFPTGAIPGAVFGIVVWLIFAAFVMPAWIGGVTDMDPPVPDWNALSFIGHIVYGAAVGAIYPVMHRASVAAESTAK